MIQSVLETSGFLWLALSGEIPMFSSAKWTMATISRGRKLETTSLFKLSFTCYYIITRFVANNLTPSPWVRDLSQPSSVLVSTQQSLRCKWSFRYIFNITYNSLFYLILGIQYSIFKYPQSLTRRFYLLIIRLPCILTELRAWEMRREAGEAEKMGTEVVWWNKISVQTFKNVVSAASESSESSQRIV